METIKIASQTQMLAGSSLSINNEAVNPNSSDSREWDDWED